MSIEAPHSDSDLLDLLRIAGPLSVSELAGAMEVTSTAIRQRLTRLSGQMMIQREVIRNGRGRPRHRYFLSDKGIRRSGSNFSDLALVLWREVSATCDAEQRRDMLKRIAQTLATGYSTQVQGENKAERIRSLSELLKQRQIPTTVDESDKPALTAHACPYPKLAEEDRGVCTMEKMLFSELVGENMELTQCRLDGDCGCRFQTS
jgi:DeoR family transcriptional regulator, suf operon transcriptional repressor